MIASPRTRQVALPKSSICIHSSSFYRLLACFYMGCSMSSSHDQALRDSAKYHFIVILGPSTISGALFVLCSYYLKLLASSCSMTERGWDPWNLGNWWNRFQVAMSWPRDCRSRPGFWTGGDSNVRAEKIYFWGLCTKCRHTRRRLEEYTKKPQDG